MKIINDYDLKKSTTFHIGGIAKKYYIPESEKELIDLLNNEMKDEKKFYIISGGSNLLINDKKKFNNVIDARSIDKSFKRRSKGNYYVGCSNRIQKVINNINQDGYGGFEELISLPALFGGIICMNAGIGSKDRVLFTISDFIEKVKVIDLEEMKIKWINKSECDFSHRHSIFQNGNYFILGANINVYKQSKEKSQERIKKRIKQAKKYEWGKGCFGSCFSEADSKLLKIISIVNINKKGIFQSKTNSNWLVNDGNGSFRKAMIIINKCIKIHRLFHKKIKCEVIIWK